MKKLLLVVVTVFLPLQAMAQSYVYDESFMVGTTYTGGDSQFDNWTSFTSDVASNSSSIGRVTFSGSNDPTVYTCDNATAASQIASAMVSGTVNVACDGNTWDVRSCGAGQSIGINAGGCDCGTNVTLRPQVNNSNWGGFNSQSCQGSPDQSFRLVFESTGPTEVPAVPVVVLGVMATLLGAMGALRLRRRKFQ